MKLAHPRHEAVVTMEYMDVRIPALSRRQLFGAAAAVPCSRRRSGTVPAADRVRASSAAVLRGCLALPGPGRGTADGHVSNVVFRGTGPRSAGRTASHSGSFTNRLKKNP